MGYNASESPKVTQFEKHWNSNYIILNFERKLIFGFLVEFVVPNIVVKDMIELLLANGFVEITLVKSMCLFTFMCNWYLGRL